MSSGICLRVPTTQGIMMTLSWRLLLLIALYVGLFASGWWIEKWFMPTGSELDLKSNALMFTTLATTFGVFIITSALPFVPGAEIGFGLRCWYTWPWFLR
jgi:hypothetical protein